MKYLAASLLLVSPLALANYNSNADANANGTVINQSPYNATILDSEMPNTRFSRDNVTCPTAKLDIALLPSYNNYDYGGDTSGVTAMLGYSMPMDLNGTIDRCKQQQRVLIRQSELQSERQERLSSFEILDKCVQLAKAGIIIQKSEDFPWADKCAAVTLYTTRGMTVDQADDINHHRRTGVDPYAGLTPDTKQLITINGTQSTVE